MPFGRKSKANLPGPRVPAIHRKNRLGSCWEGLEKPTKLLIPDSMVIY